MAAGRRLSRYGGGREGESARGQLRLQTGMEKADFSFSLFSPVILRGRNCRPTSKLKTNSSCLYVW